MKSTPGDHNKIWLADYPVIEAFNKIELFRLFPPKMVGFSVLKHSHY